MHIYRWTFNYVAPDGATETPIPGEGMIGDGNQAKIYAEQLTENIFKQIQHQYSTVQAELFKEGLDEERRQVIQNMPAPVKPVIKGRKHEIISDEIYEDLQKDKALIFTLTMALTMVAEDWVAGKNPGSISAEEVSKEYLRRAADKIEGKEEAKVVLAQ